MFLYLMKYCLLLIGLLLSLSSWCTESECFRFRVYLKDKGDYGLLLDTPEHFLSERAIERRAKQHLSIDKSDLPVFPDYKNKLMATGVRFVAESKWMNTVVVESADSAIIFQLKRLPMVDSVCYVWKGVNQDLPKPAKKDPIVVDEEKEKSYYGYADDQIKILNGKKLHQAGFKGVGIQIAIIDAGFANVDCIDAFQTAKILGTYDASAPGKSVFEGDEHGTKVFSCLASCLPHVIVGTAPEASYWLIKSEDTQYEYPIEEDYWAAAVEFADSVGVDIVTSSLGYYSFDDSSLNYEHGQLNGKIAFISQVASKAVKKGMLVFTSAGNEGNTEWHKITFPGDAYDVITVGSVAADKRYSSFSSCGFTADGRLKPDVVSMGSGCAVLEADGVLRYANGTSFSTPILAGLGACLWQALPQLTAEEIKMLVFRCSSKQDKPNASMGRGIPDMYKSYKKGCKYAAGRNK